jgi:acetoin utilization deacetylase AcuC-like enzyme
MHQARLDSRLRGNDGMWWEGATDRPSPLRLRVPTCDISFRIGMNSTGLVFDSRFQDHDTGRGHPERPERIAVLSGLADDDTLQRVEPRPATAAELTLVHGEGHFDAVARTNGTRSAFDADTPVSARSFDTASLAAGGVLALVDEVMAGRLRNGFACVRPPGHHAERDRAMGFCLFNNVAVAAAHARARYGLERIVILDWDVHHGNGTQHMFERDPGVLYISTHQYPFYPGTGAADEVGEGPGEGFTVNVPLPAGCGDAEYLDTFDSVIEPIIEQYAPQLVLISAGFDPHVRDPLGGMRVTEAGFAAMTRSLSKLAQRSASGRCVAVLEGGYDLGAVRDSARTVLNELQGRAVEPADPPGASQIGRLLTAVRAIQAPYWKF